MQTKNVIMSLFLGSFLCSCSTVREVHYFKDQITSTSPSGIISNYYKVEIKGGSLLSSSRYISGYFDQSAINLYFNEFSQPKNGKLFGTEESPSAFTDEEGNELVLIFSSNAKAVSDQIGTIAKNQVVLNSAAALIQKEKLEEAQNLKIDIAAITAEKENFVLLTDLYLKDITTKTQSEKKLAIEQLLEAIK